MKFLRIAAWNINGLSPNKQEAELVLKHNNIDILLISESHMTDERIINIQGYNVYYTNHPDGTSHAGTAIIIKENIKHHVLGNYKQQHLQATVVAVDDWQGPLAVAAVYCPPKHRINEQMFATFFQLLATDLSLQGIGTRSTTSGVLE